jgi:hypothetical protein
MASVSKNLKSLNPIQFQVFNKEVIHLESHPELIKEEKLILKKCSGLPLAIVTIGGFLANQPKTARAGDRHQGRPGAHPVRHHREGIAADRGSPRRRDNEKRHTVV